jgi:RNA polymerase sigma factor (sigma-70 family)
MNMLERSRSYDLLRVMQNSERSDKERTDAFDEILKLDWGFWQPENATNPQSLRKFALDAARKTIHRYGVRKYARMRALDPDDLSQELLLCLFQNAAKIRGIEKSRAWLIAVAVQMARHYVSENAATEFAPDFDALTPPADGPGPGESAAPADAPHVVTPEDIEKFRERTKTLTPHEQQAMEYRYVEGLSDPGVAVAMDRSEPAVRQTLSRAHRKLREHLREKQTPPADAPPANDAPSRNGSDEESK